MASRATAAELFESGDLEKWRAALESYGRVVQSLDSHRTRKKKQTKKGNKEESLTSLDHWYQDTLPTLVKSRDPSHVTQEELCKLMKWKLTRGKFRPRLTELVRQNSPEDVREISEKAFAQLPDLQPAIQTLTQLKAVGPATASAILCVVCPEKAPFMADESFLAVEGLGKLDYTLKQYLLYAKKLQEKARQLNKTDKTGQRWTAHSVELSLWAEHFSHLVSTDLPPTAPPAKTPKLEESP